MDISIYSKVSNNKSFNIGDSVANQNKSFDSVHGGSKKNIVTKTTDSRNLTDSTTTEEYDLSGDTNSKETNVDNSNSNKNSTTNPDIKNTNTPDNSTNNSNSMNNNQADGSNTAKNSNSNNYQNGVNNQNNNGNQTTSVGNGNQGTTGNGSGSNGTSTNNGYNGIGNNNNNGTGTDINNDDGANSSGSKSIVNPETNKITITTIDENGKEVPEEISVEEFREKLRKDGLTDVDIDRVIDGVIQLVDLYEEIEADSDNSRRRRLLAAQYIKIFELDFDTLDDLAEQIDTDQATLNKLIEEKNKKESVESHEYEAVQNLINNITGAGGYITAPVAWEYTDDDGNIKYTFEEPQELKLGIMNHDTLYGGSGDSVNSKYTPKTFKELFPDSEYYDQIAALATKEEKGIFTKTTVYKWDNNSDAQIKFLDDLHKKYGTDSENRDERLEEIDSEIEALTTKIENNQAYLDYINGRLDYSMKYIDPYIYQSDYSANNTYKGNYVEKYDLDSWFKEEREANPSWEGVIYIDNKEQVIDALAGMINGEISTDGIVSDFMLCVDAPEVGNDYATIFNHYMSFIEDMSDDEKGAFNYIYNTQGYEKAFEYLQGISTELDTRVTLRKQAEDEEFALEHPVIASIASVFITPLEGLSAACSSLYSLIIDDRIWRVDVYSSGDVYRNAIAADIAEDHPTLSFVYSTGMSMVDTAVLIGAGLVTGGAALPLISATFMGSRAYVSTLNNALDRGISDGKAIALAFSAAVVETAMESWSAGHLLNLEGKIGKETVKLTAKISTSISNPTLANFASKGFYITASAVSQGLCEGEEEFATEILNYACDYLIAEDKSKYTTSMEKYMKMGYTADEAFTFTMKELEKDVEMAFLGGFVSGCCFGGFSGVKTTYDMSTTIASEINAEMANTTKAVAFSNALSTEFNVETNNNESMANTAPLPVLGNNSITTQYESSVSQKELDAAIKAIEKVIIKYKVWKNFSTFQSLEKIGETIIAKDYKNSTILFGIRKTLKQHSFQALATAFEIVYNEEFYYLHINTEKIINSIMAEKNLSKDAAINLLTKYSNGFVSVNFVTADVECQNIIKEYSEEEIKDGIRYYKSLQSDIKDLNIVLDILCKKYNSDINSAINKVERYISTHDLNSITRDNGARNIIKNMGYDNVCNALSKIKYEINQKAIVEQRNKMLTDLWTSINRDNCNHEAITLLYNSLVKQLNLNNEYAERFINQIIDVFNMNEDFSIESNSSNLGFFRSSDNVVEVGKNYIKIGNDGTLFHELGHALFYNILKEVPPSNFDEVINIAKNNSLNMNVCENFNRKIQQISRDVRAKAEFAYVSNLAAQGLTIEQYKQNLKAEYNTKKYEKIFKEHMRLSELGVDEKTIDLIIDTKNDVDAIVANTIEAEIKVIEDNIWRTEYSGYTAVTDIIDAVYLGKKSSYAVKYNHGDEYYNNFDNHNKVVKMQFHEIIANYSHLAMQGDTECIQLIETVLGSNFVNVIHGTFENMLNTKYVPSNVTYNKSVSNFNNSSYVGNQTKHINQNFEEISNNKERVDTVIDKINKFIKSNLSDSMINGINTEEILIQVIDSNEFSIKLHNGNIRKFTLPSNVGACKVNMEISLDNEKLSIVPGIVLRPNFNEHQLVHEYFHALSSKKNCHIDENGIVYSKVGTKVDYYDKNLEDSNYYPAIGSDALNEGITEMFATKVDNKYTGNYAAFTVAAELLTYNNDLLLKAYFSEDIQELIDFYDDFELKQDILKRNDLINYSSKDLDEQKLIKLVKGSIEYGLATCPEENKTEFISFVNNRLKRLDDNYILDSGSWSDLLIDTPLSTPVMNNSVINSSNNISVAAKPQSFYDMEKLLNSVINTNNVDSRTAYEYIKNFIDGKVPINQITNNIGLQNLFRNYNKSDLLNGFHSYQIFQSNVEKIEWAIQMIQEKYNYSYEKALNQIRSYIETGDATKITRQGNARNVITSMNIAHVQEAYLYIRTNMPQNIQATPPTTNYIENEASLALKREIVDTVNINDADYVRARKAYIELNKRISYDVTFHNVDAAGKQKIFNSVRSFNDLYGTSVVCSGWSYLYREVLLDLGFEASNVKIMGGNQHKWVEINLGDGNIIIADATDAIGHGNDLANCKFGSKTHGFFYTDPSMSGRRLVKIDNIVSLTGEQFKNIDNYIGYTKQGSYLEDIYEKQKNLIQRSKDKNLASNLYATEDMMFGFNFVGVDGLEVCVFYNKIIRILDISDTYKVEYKNYKLSNGKYDSIAAIKEYDSNGNVIKVMLYGESIGKMNFNSIEAYNQYLKFNLGITDD